MLGEPSVLSVSQSMQTVFATSFILFVHCMSIPLYGQDTPCQLVEELRNDPTSPYRRTPRCLHRVHRSSPA